MSKKYLEKNVLEAAKDRLRIMFENFEHIYFSVSGGKDSSVMVQLANMIAKELNKKFDVLYIDLEAQYSHTIAHIEELKKLSQINDFYHIALPMALRNAISVLQPKWICWEEESKHLWVRDMPKDSINIHNCPFEWFKKGEEFEEFIVQFAQWYLEKYPGKVACGIGIRTDESLNRFRTIAFQDKKIAFDGSNQKFSNVLSFQILTDSQTADFCRRITFQPLLIDETVLAKTVKCRLIRKIRH